MAAGTPSRLSTPAFHGDDVEQTGEYRTLSVLAILSLVFGLASPLSFAGPLLMAIPIVGIAVSILALRRIAANPGVLAGRGAAVCGLVLCIVFAVAPMTRSFVLRTMRAHQAERFARSWIGLLLAGHAEEAFRITSEGASPRGPAPGEPPAKTTPYEAFTSDPPVKALVAAGADADVRLESTLGYERLTSRVVSVRQQFEVVPPAKENAANSNVPPVDVILTMRRTKLPGEGGSRWIVSSIESAPTAADAAPGK